ncbi:DHA2 family efflux MFS transporter permease subunit [Mycobacterium spongiae]|uniref:DHA2 family efflux MFS transporter permease subunit n=1 Tax=Mycobacterium spongiae TaxID=886343 RepID=A0A975JW61_9MYCO|nr:DHA2 family efflux MFS transporter permease subunit [Mycobacterium spongiae]QUR66781.1 DHA2 family efflux MFS transporter permease subunit [Mycobacterium spongiae]
MDSNEAALRQGRERSGQAALYALCVSFFMVGVDASIVNVAIPAMQTALDATLNDMVWVNSIYALCLSVPLIMAGRLGDRFGPKRLFLVGLAGFTAASLACALAPEPEILIAARAAQGLAAALVIPQTMSLIVHIFPAERRGAALGIWSAVGAAAMAAGPLMGGVLVASVGWRWIFLINVPIGIAGWIAALRFVPDYRPHHQHRFDLLGVALSGTGLFAVVFAIQSGEHYDWGIIAGPISIASVAITGVICLLVFVLWQNVNSREPLLPLRLFTNRNFSTASTAGLAMGAAMGGLFLPLMIYLQTTLGYSPLVAGAATVPMFVLSSWCAHAAGRASDRWNPALISGAGFAVLAVGIAALVWVLDPGVSLWLLMAPMLVAGVGLGGVSAPLAGIATRTVPTELVGAASGVFNTTRQLGGALGSAATGVLLQAGIGPTTTTATQASLVFPIVMLVMGVGCCALMRKPAMVFHGRSGRN